MKKKILFIIDSLTGGGAEKVLVNLVNNMDTNKYDITVETMFFNGVNARFLKPEIKLFCKKAPCFHGVSHIIKRIPDRVLYKYFIGQAKYDVVVAFMHGASAKVVAGCPDKKIKKYAWIHINEMEHGTIWKFYPTRKQTVESYSRFDKVVAVSETVKDAFEKYSHLGEKIIVKYNVNDTQRIKKMSEEEFERNKDTFYISTFGRLSSQKGFDRLIRISKKLKDEGKNFEMHIFGKGEDEKILSDLIAENKVGGTVFLDGFTDNPYKIMKNSDLFVCSSLYEGLSTAMSEAVILGVPVVTTDVSGAKEVLGNNNEYGIVTENDEDKLYEALKDIIENKKLYNEYKEKVLERGTFFDTEKTVEAVCELF
ncbi:MAG: glycosyltransferase [Clostridia bacterium]|nr:glycosyltransferase [Clostridia bacterium]